MYKQEIINKNHDKVYLALPGIQSWKFATLDQKVWKEAGWYWYQPQGQMGKSRQYAILDIGSKEVVSEHYLGISLKTHWGYGDMLNVVQVRGYHVKNGIKPVIVHDLSNHQGIHCWWC